MFQVFLDVLSERRVAFLRSICSSISQIIPAILNGSDSGIRYRFESIEGAVIKKERYDSDRFVELCEVDADESSVILA
jgi:hypothetical protein